MRIIQTPAMATVSRMCLENCATFWLIPPARLDSWQRHDGADAARAVDDLGSELDADVGRPLELARQVIRHARPEALVADEQRHLRRRAREMDRKGQRHEATFAR